MKNVSDKCCAEKKTHTFYAQWTFFFFRKTCRLWNNMKKYGGVRHATDDKMALAHCMLDTYGYRHTIRTCFTSCFRRARTFTRTRLDVTVLRTFPVLLIFRIEILIAPVHTSHPLPWTTHEGFRPKFPPSNTGQSMWDFLWTPCLVRFPTQ